MELRLPLEMSPGREAACRAVFGTWEELKKQAENRKQASQGKGEGSYIQPKASESPRTIKKNPKIKVSACGSKMKKVSKKQTGGSLNGIPFM